MAMDSQRILEIVLRAKDETAKGIKSASDRLGGAQANMGMVAGGAAAVGAGAAIAVTLDKAAGAAAAYGSQVVTIQRLTGASAQESSKWAAILGRYGVEGKQVGLVVKSLDNAIVGHSKDLAAAGIATQDASGKNRSAQAVLADLAQYYSTATDKTAATALAAKTLGKGYMTLLPVLANGKKGIDDLSAAAQANGKIMSQDQIDTVKKYSKALKDNQDAESGLTIQAGLMVLPFKTMIEQGIGKVLAFFVGMPGPLKALVVVGAAVTAGLLLIGGALTMLVGIAPMFSVGLAAVTGAFSAEAIAAAGAWLATAGPVLLVIAAIALVAGGVYLIIKNWKGVSKFFGDLWKGVIKGVTGFAASTGKAFSSLWTKTRANFAKWGPGILAVIMPFIGIPLLIIKNWDKIGPALGRIWNTAKRTVENGVNGVVRFVKDMPHKIVQALAGIGSAVRNAISGAVSALGNLNPFQRHSPSLVDNVIAGAATIAKHYRGLGGMRIGAPVIGAMGVPSVAYAGMGGFGGSVAAARGTNSRLVEVLERLERNGVVANMDGTLVSRGLGKTTVASARSGAH